MCLGVASSTLVGHSFPANFGGGLILSSALQKHAVFDKLEFEVATKKGARWMSVSGTPRLSRMGNFEGFRGIGLDITEHKLSNDRLVNLANIDSLPGLPNRTHISQLFEEGSAKPEKGMGRSVMPFRELEDRQSVVWGKNV